MHEIRRIAPGFALASLFSLLAAVACGPSGQTQQPPGDSLLTIPEDAPTNSSSCDARLDYAHEAMDQVTTAANGPCTRDAECTVVFAETQCFGACQAPILESRLTAFREAQDAIDERVCTNYVEAGCAYATPACLAVEAVCENNRCALRELRD